MHSYHIQRSGAMNSINCLLVASLLLQEMGKAFLLEGSAKSQAFVIYIEQILAPGLQA
jgi:hypothetical protein